MLILPATAGDDRGFIAAAEAAPEELSTIANVMPAPPMPFVPAEHHGKLVIMALLAHAGERRGRRARHRAVPGPRHADRGHGPPDAVSGDLPARGRRYHPIAVAPDDVRRRGSTGVAETIMDTSRRRTRSMRGGPAPRARRRDGPRSRDATAFAHRDSQIMVNVAAFYDDPSDRPGAQAGSPTSPPRSQGEDGART